MKSQKERMLAGELYIADDAELGRENRRAKQLTRQFNQTTEDQMAERQQLLTAMFKRIGKKGYIEPPFRTDYGTNTTIGDNVYMGPRVGLYTAGHPIDAEIRAEQLEYGWPITIGNDVWFGGNVVVNPGVTIGSNVVIGSGSIVTHDIPDNVVAVGNPCRVLRPITEQDHDYWKQKRAVYFADQDDSNND